MCFHNSLTVSAKSLENRFGLQVDFDFEPVFHTNGFSHRLFPVVTKESISLKSWGLAPFWCKDLDKVKQMQNSTLNCRIETALEKPSFRHLVSRKHCLVPSTAFFEFRHFKDLVVPYKIFVPDLPIFSFAGFYESWHNKDDNSEFHTFTILTTQANSLMSYIHNKKLRMPVILSPDQEVLWLSESFPKPDLHDYYDPFPESLMSAHTISKLLVSRKSNTNVPEVLDVQDYGEHFMNF